jgi:hypothetical protein
LSRTGFAGDAFAGGGHGSSEEEESAVDRTASNILRIRILGSSVYRLSTASPH